MCGVPHSNSQQSLCVQQEEGCDEQQTHIAFLIACTFSYDQRLRIFFLMEISDYRYNPLTIFPHWLLQPPERRL